LAKLNFKKFGMTRQIMKYLNKTALVTGASAGIGAEFARQLAGHGCALILVARRLERLQQLADEIQAAHGSRCNIIALDLSDPKAGSDLMAQLQQRGLRVDLLINNAGYGLPGHLISQDWSAHAASLQLMLASPTELCRMFLPGMIANGFGRIINVASLAGHVPSSAGHTTYGAIKSYLIRFSESLALEMQQTGAPVKVLALCPGFTYSEFHDVNGARARVNQLPKFMWLDAPTVVSQGLAALERGERMHINGRVNRLIAAVCKYLPTRLANALLNRHANKFREPSGDQNPS
jgi:uncharacterized protein